MHLRAMTIPEPIQHKIDMFRSSRMPDHGAFVAIFGPKKRDMAHT
jgi:hypothetical protein